MFRRKNISQHIAGLFRFLSKGHDQKRFKLRNLVSKSAIRVKGTPFFEEKLTGKPEARVISSRRKEQGIALDRRSLGKSKYRGEIVYQFLKAVRLDEEIFGSQLVAFLDFACVRGC